MLNAAFLLEGDAFVVASLLIVAWLFVMLSVDNHLAVQCQSDLWLWDHVERTWWNGSEV